MTTGAAMAATGTDLREEPATGGEDEAVEVDTVDDGAGVIGIDEDVLFCWSVGVSLELNSCLLETYTRPIPYCARSIHRRPQSPLRPPVVGSSMLQADLLLERSSSPLRRWK